MDERTKKNTGLRYPAELKKKALLELAESGNAGAVVFALLLKSLPFIIPCILAHKLPIALQ